jgi:hypothetical protein
VKQYLLKNLAVLQKIMRFLKIGLLVIGPQKKAGRFAANEERR